MIELLHAIWQADSGFPSGSFAFSGGLEAFYALPEADGAALPALLHDMLALRWASSDRVALPGAHRAAACSAPIAPTTSARLSAGWPRSRRPMPRWRPRCWCSPCAKARAVTAWRCWPRTNGLARPGPGAACGLPRRSVPRASGGHAGRAVPRHRHGSAGRHRCRRLWRRGGAGHRGGAARPRRRHRGSARLVRRIAAAGRSCIRTRRRPTPCPRRFSHCSTSPPPATPAPECGCSRPETRQSCC